MNSIQILYSKISEENLWCKTITLKRKEYLKTSGTIDTNLYYIETGSLALCVAHKNDHNIIRFGYDTNFITALDSFITEKPSDLYIQAIKETTLKVISKKRYLDFMHQNSEYKLLWDKLLEQILLQQIEREKDILISSPKERYKRVLERSPQLFQKIPHKYIASYLRMTPETLSRLKKY